MDAIQFQNEPATQNRPQWMTGVSALLLEMVLVIAILYLDRHGTITTLLRDWGAWGIAFSVGLMAVISIVPIPGEFLLILNMKLYGVLLGVLCAWAGTVIGALITFVLARHVAAPLIQRFVTKEHWIRVESWVQRQGAVGLLFARLLPIPAPIVNYAAGLLDSIRLWDYLWTAALSIWPYYIGVASLYTGVPHRFSPSVVLGIGVFVALWVLGFLLNKRVSHQPSS
ncbi:MAG: VTT domain-containing protein [Alicyclobacillus macrosporangiidus]|uniref:TVP38/TMEM64 family protein n=1 Tax=Alicyclobacillus macrosporangiidus TaxID=392015 RepID=UPI0026E92160|nr:VTT domain-containing protein [Alicyclobacillus macrosporangiidus]MCL6600963.1 VTT domain-containing protein [Alicyclobacillus macrosporangiidus]